MWHNVMCSCGLRLVELSCCVILLAQEHIYLFQSVVDYVPVWLVYCGLCGVCLRGLSRPRRQTPDSPQYTYVLTQIMASLGFKLHNLMMVVNRRNM